MVLESGYFGETNASYWDTGTLGPLQEPWGQSTAELQGPTAYGGIYGTWNLDLDGDGSRDDPWDFGTASQYPVLSVDMDGDSAATWTEFGYQLRSGPVLTAHQPAGKAEVELAWTSAGAGWWSPSPGVTYNLTRAEGDAIETLGAGLDQLSFTDADVTADVTYKYQVAAVVQGGEATRSAAVELTVTNQPPAAVGTLPNPTVRLGDGVFSLDVSDAFEDPEDDDLSFDATSSELSIATARISGTQLMVTPLRVGTTMITVTATDGRDRSAAQSLLVTVVRPPGVTLSPNLLNLAEGSAGAYSVVLHSRPSDQVTVTVTVTAPVDTDASVDRTALLFTQDDWHIPQWVEVRAAEDGDAVADPPVEIIHTATGGDYEGVPVDSMTVHIAEDDEPRVSVSEKGLQVEEGDRGAYSVALMSQPTEPVEVTLVLDPSDGDISLSRTTLAFAREDWSAQQEVEVTASADDDAEADPATTIRHTVSGGDYARVKAPSVQVTIVETDAPTLSAPNANSSEDAGVLEFRITLSRASSTDVTVEYETVDGAGVDGARAGSDYAATEGALTFPAGSSATRTVAVPLTDDTADEEEEEEFVLVLRNVSPVDGGQTLRATGTIRDNDDPAVEASFSGVSREVTEGGRVKFTVSLSADPERLVEIPFAKSHHGGATELDYSGLPPSLVFVGGETRREIVFTAVDDLEDDDGEAVELTFGRLPPGVTGSGRITLAIQDNDGSGGGGDPGNGGGGGGGGGGGPGSGDAGDGGDSGGGPPPGDDDSGPPMAAFAVEGATCDAELCRTVTGEAVQFTDTSSGTVRSRSWEFGDGKTSRSRRVEHSWSSPGFYEVTLSVNDGTILSTAKQVFLVAASEPAGSCVADAETLCLQDSRYSVSVEWRKEDGESRSGRVVYQGTNDSGLFTFFSHENWEILIKVLDGCAANGHAWVYGASTTDLGYTIRVADTVTGAVKRYRNEPGLPAPAITDATAFPEGCSGKAR